MNRAERRAAARASRRPARRAASKRSLVTVAVEQYRMRRVLDDIAIRAYLTLDGAIDRELIAQFVFLIGLGAEVSCAMADDEERTRRLHFALRTLTGMSVNGGRWQAAQSARMYELACEANKLSIDNVDLALPRYVGARNLSDAIAAGKARMEDVAGVEIYAEAV